MVGDLDVPLVLARDGFFLVGVDKEFEDQLGKVVEI